MGFIEEILTPLVREVVFEAQLFALSLLSCRYKKTYKRRETREKERERTVDKPKKVTERERERATKVGTRCG